MPSTKQPMLNEDPRILIGLIPAAFALVVLFEHCGNVYQTHKEKMSNNPEYRQTYVSEQEKTAKEIQDIRLSWAEYCVIGR